MDKGKQAQCNLISLKTHNRMSVNPLGNRITFVLETDGEEQYGSYDNFLTWMEGVILPRFFHETW